MSTNSLVAIVNTDESVTASYVHYDGYETGVGLELLENYNATRSAARVARVGYASSLKSTVAESRKDAANSDEAMTFENYSEFEKYIFENSYLEFVYLWNRNEKVWSVGSYSRTKISGEEYEYRYDWTGFEKLSSAFVREGYATVDRIRSNEGLRTSKEYLEWAGELLEIVRKWNKVVSLDIGNELARA